MSRNMHMRLAKIERRALQRHTGDIPIMCEDADTLDEVVEQYLHEGLISLDDTPRCRPWWQVKDFVPSVSHEQALEHLT